MSYDTLEDRRMSGSLDERNQWLRWGPYLSERQWGTVREDYSEGGTAWDYFPHDQARSRAYRWGEDGIAGISDDNQLLCFSLALWNGNDPILKERMFGLTNSEGNHGEDVKELYFYHDSTPSHSYMKMLYKYPHAEFPYGDLVTENGRRKSTDGSAPEYELLDTGVFDENRYFDVEVEYAKRDADDIFIRISATNKGPEAHSLVLLPTLWLRNTWSWTKDAPKSTLRQKGANTITVSSGETSIDGYRLVCPDNNGLLFCENETNTARVFGFDGGPQYPKDGINDHVIHNAETISPDGSGSKAAARYDLNIEAGETKVVTLRLSRASSDAVKPATQNKLFKDRRAEADAFYSARLPAETSNDRKNIYRQALAGMLWSKQFFYYDVSDWLDGDDLPPPDGRKEGRNHQWRHFYSKDIISMPDAWEYPWFASWDLSFHTVALARVDLQFAKDQVLLLCREWFMHPNGQVPAYEWAFDDVNPPVQAWAGLQIAQYELETFGTVDQKFCSSLFDHCLLYFSWWVNRKDAEGNNLFEGGFLGLDNSAVFDRSSGYLPGGGRLYQSDGTTWVGFFALQMMELALILSERNEDYVDFASKFFQHFIIIADAMEHISRQTDGKVSLWDEDDGLFYDVLHMGDEHIPLKVRSLVSLIPLIAVMSLDVKVFDREAHGTFKERFEWLKSNRGGLVHKVLEYADGSEDQALLSILSPERLSRVLAPMLDESEFLSPYGIRSISRLHKDNPFEITIEGQTHSVEYQPAESNSGMFGGNSNWRGPIWMPMNYILVDSLRNYSMVLGDRVTASMPTQGGPTKNLYQIADDFSNRLISIFEKGEDGKRPVYTRMDRFNAGDDWNDNILFFEYFDGDSGAGVGAAHQTGWTGLVAVLIEQQARKPQQSRASRSRKP